MNFECRSADVLSYDCDVHTKCHGHGVSRLPVLLPTCLSGESHDSGVTCLCVAGVQQQQELPLRLWLGSAFLRVIGLRWKR